MDGVMLYWRRVQKRHRTQLLVTIVFLLAILYLAIHYVFDTGSMGNVPERGETKRILVTGAAGFVGFHSIQALKARGDYVIGLDNFNHYYDVRLKRDRESILKSKQISIVEGDVCDSSLLLRLFDEHRPTHVLHLAAQAGVRYSLKDPLAYVRANVECFVTLLEVLRFNRHVRLIYASSSSVYGLNTKVPFAETDDVSLPASLYAATKRENELIAHVYHNLYRIYSTGLRFFTVYGPYGRPDMAYFSFAEAIIANRPIQVYNNGKVSRDFTYIDDIVSGVVAAIDLSAELEIFNLGGHQPHSVLELISCLERELELKAVKNFTEAAPGDVLITYADLSHSRHRLGYEPRTPLAAGIRRFIQWYLQWRKENKY